MERKSNPFASQPPGFEDAKKAYKKYSKTIKFAVLLILLFWLAMASYYQVEPDEVGVVTRFGRFLTISEAGPHFRIPVIDQVLRIPAKRQLKKEFGFRTDLAGVKSAFRRNAATLQESMMLTGDLNVAIVEWIVHYKIADPYQYIFKVRNVEETLGALSEATMRKVVGDYSVTEVLTSGREQILERARIELSKLLKRYETGIAVQRIELKDSAPPDPVKPSFNEVNQAEQERDRLQNEAWARYNQSIPNARGEAKQIVEEAEGYAVERVNNARGDAERFLAVQKEYSRAPAVTRTRLYLETMSEVLPKVGRKVLVDEKAQSIIPLLFPADNSSSAVKPLGEGGAR